MLTDDKSKSNGNLQRTCVECGDPLNTLHLDETPLCPGGCRNPFLSCDACGGGFRPEQPPDAGQKLYELHGCVWGKRKAQQDARTCKHCGAVTGGSRCGCPEAIAQLKADDEAADKKNKEVADQAKLDRAIFEKERVAKRLQEEERMEEFSKAGIAAERKARQRNQLDLELRDREQALKGRELARSERRNDSFDAIQAIAAEATEPAAELTFADFRQEVTLRDVARLPSAFMREDNETLLYEGKANTIFGEPSSAKSWIGLMAAIQQLRAGRRVIWWDNEDRADTQARRLQILRAEELIGIESFAFAAGDMHKSETVMAEALVWLAGGNGPGLVVIDSATAHDCPKDGADVHPWMKAHINPWIDAGHTSLTLDHVPKQRKDRPAGAVGSFEKLSFIRGAALYVHGIAWDEKHGGAVHLTVHKDAHGQLPAPKLSVASTVSAQWDGPFLDWKVGMPNAKTESEDLQDELMDAFFQKGTDTVRGSQGVRELLKGKRGRDIDKAREELLHLGLIHREKDGRAFVYTIVADND